VLGDRCWLYATKKRIFVCVSHGVDTQPQVVDICKVRLSLSLMVDYEMSADPDNCEAKSFRTALKGIEPLPNLDFTIRRANSFVDSIPRRAGGIEKASSKSGAGLVQDDRDAERVSELGKGLKELGFASTQVRATRMMWAAGTGGCSGRIRARFDDPAKPIFVWQLSTAMKIRVVIHSCPLTSLTRVVRPAHATVLIWRLATRLISASKRCSPCVPPSPLWGDGLGVWCFPFVPL
jgi:hypothetical protein